MDKQIYRERKDFSTVRELVEWAGSTHGDKPAYSYRLNPGDSEPVRISFNRLRQDVRSLASELIAMGCAGKHIAVIGKLSYDFALMYFSVLSIGAVLVPLDRDWHSEDLADTCSKAEADFLFIDEDIADKAPSILERCPGCHAPVYMNAVHNSDCVALLTTRGSLKYAENPKAYSEAPIDPDALSLLVFTSGTTGKGKGVMLTQTAVLLDITCAIPYIDVGKNTIGVLPPHHTYGSTVMFIGHAAFGAEVYISSGLRHITKELKEQKPEHMVMVPLYLETFYRRIMSTVKEQGKDKLLFNMIKVSNGLRKVGIDRRKQLFASLREAFGGELRTIVSGGAPINQEILEFFESIGINTLNGYGITECAPLIAVNRSKNVVPGSVGNVIPIDHVIIDEPNEFGEGEILVKGPNVMLGYFGDEAATSAVFTDDGYFRTGDYGRLDNGDILTITGRKKNLIILSNGKNVYPEEIENEIIAVPGVLEIVVYEGKSRRKPEYNAIVAEIFPDEEYIKKNGIEDVKAYLKKYIDDYNKTAVPYKKIQVLKIRKSEFPKNTLRKIKRFEIDTEID
ncbi:MAG: AMP-binding protein [Clostridia bacterium]|nr:AMP-binding protein [Clostridia bacterium]